MLWPPKLEVLLAWSRLFRCSGTLQNYLGYVKTGCMLVMAGTEVGYTFGQPRLSWENMTVRVMAGLQASSTGQGYGFSSQGRVVHQTRATLAPEVRFVIDWL